MNTEAKHTSWTMRAAALGATLVLTTIASAWASSLHLDLQASASAPVASAEGPIRWDKGPSLLYAPNPEFPPKDRPAHGRFQGVVVVRTVISAQGKPTQVQVVRSLGPDFDHNAIDAVQRYRFHPAMRAGKPVAAAIQIEVNYATF